MSIIELLALDYLFADMPAGVQYLLVIYFFGAIIGPLTKIEFRMSRSAYFLSTALLIFGCVEVDQLFTLLLPYIVAHGYAALTVILETCIWFMSAYALVVIGKARSNDAYGHARYAILAFIPVVNFMLCVAEPQKAKEEDVQDVQEYEKVKNGISYISIVFAVLVLIEAGINRSLFFPDKLENLDADTRTLMNQRLVAYEVHSEGLQEALLNFKSREPEGEVLADGIFLLKLTVTDDNALIYHYLVDSEEPGLDQRIADALPSLQSRICLEKQWLTKLGAAVVWVYHTGERGLEPLLVEADEPLCTEFLADPKNHLL